VALARGKILGFLLFLAVCLWRLTLRIRLVGLEHRLAVTGRGLPAVHALWHQRMVLGILRHPWIGVMTMASRSADGEIITTFLRLWGFQVARGSSSRGGASALRALVEHVRGTVRNAAITTDGPRGPARRSKVGVAFLAEELDAPIIPMSASSTRPRFLSSWDRYLVPLPFSRCVVLMGPAVERLPGESHESFCRRLDTAIDGLTEEADRLCGVRDAPRERCAYQAVEQAEVAET